jgi:periplasmic divalent cation tolerance protein
MNIVILITCVNKAEANRISKRLIRQRLIACVNLVEKIKSVFWWQERIDSATEVLLIAKSKKSLIRKIVKQVKSLHSYKVPEVIAFPIIAGNKDYINWINESIRQSS